MDISQRYIFTDRHTYLVQKTVGMLLHVTAGKLVKLICADNNPHWVNCMGFNILLTCYRNI